MASTYSLLEILQTCKTKLYAVFVLYFVSKIRSTRLRALSMPLNIRFSNKAAMKMVSMDMHTKRITMGTRRNFSIPKIISTLDRKKKKKKWVGRESWEWKDTEKQQVYETTSKVLLPYFCWGAWAVNGTYTYPLMPQAWTHPNARANADTHTHTKSWLTGRHQPHKTKRVTTLIRGG